MTTQLSTWEYADKTGKSASNVSRNARFENLKNMPGVESIEKVGARFILHVDEVKLNEWIENEKKAKA